MLDAMRGAAKSWVAKALMALLVLSFAVWGIGDIFRGFGEGTVITVGDTKISEQEFRTELDRELRNLGRQIGQPLTLEQARALGLDQRLVGRLVTEAVLDETGRRMGLSVSDEVVVREIMQDPTFQNALGRFDRTILNEILRANGLSEADLINIERRATVREQLAGGLAGGASAPNLLIEALHRYRNEARRIAYVTLGPEAAGAIPDPDQATLETYFNENRQAFRAPEYRKLAILSVTPDSIARTLEVTEQDAREVYESQKSRFATAERRTVDQIVFEDLEAALAASERIKGGVSFDVIATERRLGPEDISLGTKTKAELLDPAVAEAAFSLPEGAVSEPVQGRFGAVLVRVRGIEPAVVRPYEEVQEQIKSEIARDRATSEILDLHDRIEDERAGGATLAEIAQRINVPLQQVEAVDRTGSGPAGVPLENAPPPAVLAEAFEGDVGIEIDPVSLDDRGYAWVEVQEVTPARDRTLEEVRDEVVRRWREQEQRARLNELAGALVREIEGGKTLEMVAAERGLVVQEAGPFRRAESPDPLSASTVAAVFAAPEGGIAQAPAADGTSRLVFRMTEATVPPVDPQNPELAALERQIEATLTDDYLVQYVTRARNDIGVSINQAALARLLGQVQQ